MLLTGVQILVALSVMNTCFCLMLFVTYKAHQ